MVRESDRVYVKEAGRNRPLDRYGDKNIEYVKENPYELNSSKKEGSLKKAKVTTVIDADTIRIVPQEYEGMDKEEIANNNNLFFSNHLRHQEWIYCIDEHNKNRVQINVDGQPVERYKTRIYNKEIPIRFSNLDADEVEKEYNELGNLQYVHKEEGELDGLHATRFVQDLIAQKDVVLDVRTTNNQAMPATGLFNRVVATIYFKDDGEWINLNRTLLRSGLAYYDDYGESHIDPNHLIKWEEDFQHGRSQDKREQALINDDGDYETNDRDYRNKILGEFNEYKDLRIGDVKFRIPPTNINVNTISEDNPAEVLRNQTTLENSSGHYSRQVSIVLYLNGMNDINGRKISSSQLKSLEESNENFHCKLEDEDGESYYPEYYVNGLRSLLAQFSVSPFLPIENNMLNYEFQINAVSMQNITIQNVTGVNNSNYLGGGQDLGSSQALTDPYMGNFPNTLKVTLTLLEFNHTAYLNTVYPFENTFDWPLFRFNYQRLLEGTRIKHNGTRIPIIEKLDSHDFSFLTPKMTDLEDKNDAINALSQIPENPDFEKGESSYERAGSDFHILEEAIEQRERYEKDDFDIVKRYDTYQDYYNDTIINTTATTRNTTARRYYTNIIKSEDLTEVFYFPYNINKYPEVGEDPTLLNEKIKERHTYVFPIRSQRMFRIIEDIDEFSENNLIDTDLNKFYYWERWSFWSKEEVEQNHGVAILNQQQFEIVYEQIDYVFNKKYKEIREKGEQSFEDIQRNDLEKERWFFPDLNLRDIAVSQSNQVNQIKLKSHNIPTQQYIGSNDVMISLTFTTDNPAQVRVLNDMIEHSKSLQNRYGDIMNFPMLYLDNDLVSLFDLDGVGMQDMSTDNIPGIPDGREITLNLIGFKLGGEINAEIEKVGSTSNIENRSNNPDMDSYFQLKEDLKTKNLYPDLELPKYNELPINSEKYEKDNQKYLDPDFYIYYPKRLFKENLIEVLNSERDKNLKIEDYGDKHVVGTIVNPKDAEVKETYSDSIEDKEESEEQSLEDSLGDRYDSYDSSLGFDAHFYGDVNKIDGSIDNESNTISLRIDIGSMPIHINQNMYASNSKNLPNDYYRTVLKSRKILFYNNPKYSNQNRPAVLNNFQEHYQLISDVALENIRNNRASMDGLIGKDLSKALTSWATPLIKLRWFVQGSQEERIYSNRLLDSTHNTIKEPEENSYIYTRYQTPNYNNIENIRPINNNRVLSSENLANFVGPLQLPKSISEKKYDLEDIGHNPIYSFEAILNEIKEEYNKLISKVPDFEYTLSYEMNRSVIEIEEEHLQSLTGQYSTLVEMLWIIAILKHMSSFVDTNKLREFNLRGYDINKVFDDEEHMKEMDKVLDFLFENDDIVFGNKNVNIGKARVKQLLKSIIENDFEDFQDIKENVIENISLEDRWESTYSDMLEYDKRGRLVRAFPTYYLMLIDEGEEYWWWKAQDNFYDYNGVYSIDIVKDRKNVSDTCLIEMSEGRSLLTGVDEKYKRAEYDLSFGEVVESFMPWNKKQEILDAQKEELGSNIRLEAGARIHLRLGYGSSPNKLPTLFNGRITELELQEAGITFVAQGDGLELTDPLAASPNERTKNETIFPNFFPVIGGSYHQLPETIIKQTLQARDGLIKEFLNDTVHEVTGGRILDPQDRVVNKFGLIGQPDYWGNNYFIKKYNTLAKDEDDIFEMSQNIHSSQQDDSLDAIEYSIRIHGMSTWDVIQSCAMAVPNFVADTHPFGFRSTIFYGNPLNSLAYDYELNENDAIVEKTKTFRQTHFYNCLDTIIDNNVIATEKDLKTVVQPIAYKGANREQGEDDLEKVFLDKNIYPSEQRVVNIDTSVNINGRFIQDDTDAGRASAYRIARSSLQEYVKNMYKGNIVVTGDPTVKPYDYINIDDFADEMSGTVEVEKVVHTLNKANGFITTITPDPVTVHNEGHAETLNYTLYNLTIKKDFSFYHAKALFDYNFASFYFSNKLGMPLGSVTGSLFGIGNKAFEFIGPKAYKAANLFGMGLEKASGAASEFFKPNTVFSQIKSKTTTNLFKASKYDPLNIGSFYTPDNAGMAFLKKTKGVKVAKNVGNAVGKTAKGLAAKTKVLPAIKGIASIPFAGKYLIAFLAFQALDYIVLDHYRQRFEERRRNRNAVTIIPLKNNNRELVAGINGHQGALIEDDPNRWDDLWNHRIVNWFLGKSEEGAEEIKREAYRFVTNSQQERYNMLKFDQTITSEDSEFVSSEDERISSDIEYDGLDKIEFGPDKRGKWIIEAKRISKKRVAYKNLRVHPQLKNLLEEIENDRHIRFELDLRQNNNISIGSNENAKVKGSQMKELYKNGLGVRVYYNNSSERDAIINKAYSLGSKLRGFRDNGMAVDDNHQYVHLDIAPKARWRIGNSSKFITPYKWEE